MDGEVSPCWVAMRPEGRREMVEMLLLSRQEESRKEEEEQLEEEGEEWELEGR